MGLDTHKDTIAVAIAEAGQSKPRYYGEIANTPEAVAGGCQACCRLNFSRSLGLRERRFGSESVEPHLVW